MFISLLNCSSRLNCVHFRYLKSGGTDNLRSQLTTQKLEMFNHLRDCLKYIGFSKDVSKMFCFVSNLKAYFESIL